MCFAPSCTYNIANEYREFVTDEKALAELRQRFERLTGPVVNAGGVW